MELVSGLAHGFATLLSPLVLVAGALGLVTGIVAGFLPCLSPAGALALQVPLGAFIVLSFGVQSPALGSITQTLGGPRAAGQWMGIQNLCANMAGVLAPLITGFTVGAGGDFFWAFAVSAAITLAGVVAYAFVIRRVEPVLWPSPSLT